MSQQRVPFEVPDALSSLSATLTPFANSAVAMEEFCVSNLRFGRWKFTRNRNEKTHEAL